jgi:hypothetical protein
MLMTSRCLTSKNQLSIFLQQLDDEFGKETPLNKSRGKVHEYLGMTLEYGQEGCLKIDMSEYVKMVLHELPDFMIGHARTPAGNNWFDVNQECDKLDNEQKSIFVHYVMQLLYLSQRGRPDIRTAISFLCTHLKQPDKDDLKKLACVLKYLQNTINLPLILCGKNTAKIDWWVDAYYGVHSDMKSHTGGTVSMGKGCMYSTSTKQKMVTRSSTESEVLAVYEVMPQILWMANFIKDQGYDVKSSVLHQDNKSAMLLETNGRKSSTKRTRHMNIKYFYVKDNVDKKEIVIEYCPINEMIADFFTKALKGS